MTLSDFNKLQKDIAATELFTCCGSQQWVSKLMKKYPNPNQIPEATAGQIGQQLTLECMNGNDNGNMGNMNDNDNGNMENNDNNNNNALDNMFDDKNKNKDDKNNDDNFNDNNVNKRCCHGTKIINKIQKPSAKQRVLNHLQNNLFLQFID